VNNNPAKVAAIKPAIGLVEKSNRLVPSISNGAPEEEVIE